MKSLCVYYSEMPQKVGIAHKAEVLPHKENYDSYNLDKDFQQYLYSLLVIARQKKKPY